MGLLKLHWYGIGTGSLLWCFEMGRPVLVRVVVRLGVCVCVIFTARGTSATAMGKWVTSSTAVPTEVREVPKKNSMY